MTNRTYLGLLLPVWQKSCIGFMASDSFPVCIYRPQRSRGKVMFLHLCVILFTGGSLCPRGGWVSVQGVSVQAGSLSRVGSLSRGLSVQKVYVQWVCLTRGFYVHRGASVQAGSLSREVSVQGGLCPGSLCAGSLCVGGLCPEGLCQGDPHMVTCGWYAS